MTQSSAEMLRLKRSQAAGQLSKGVRTQAKVKLLLKDGSDSPFEGNLKFSDVTVDHSVLSL